MLKQQILLQMIRQFLELLPDLEAQMTDRTTKVDILQCGTAIQRQASSPKLVQSVLRLQEIGHKFQQRYLFQRGPSGKSFSKPDGQNKDELFQFYFPEPHRQVCSFCSVTTVREVTPCETNISFKKTKKVASTYWK